MSAAMWFRSLIRLLTRALVATPSLLSSNWLATGLSIVIFVVPQLATWRKEGWNPAYMKEHWKENLKIGTLTVIGAWIVLFVVSIGKSVYQDHQSLVTRIQDLSRQKAKAEAQQQLNPSQRNTETPPSVIVNVPKPKAFVDFDRMDFTWGQNDSLLRAVFWAKNKSSEVARNAFIKAGLSWHPAVNGAASEADVEADFKVVKGASASHASRAVLASQESMYADLTRSFTQADLNAINSGASVMLVMGIVEFSDDNGDHQKEFCRLVVPPLGNTAGPGFRSCEKHNDLKY